MTDTNNYFKVGRFAFLFFDDRSRASIAEALRQACRVQDLVNGDGEILFPCAGLRQDALLDSAKRICIFRKNRHSDMYPGIPEVGECVEPVEPTYALADTRAN